MLIWATNTLLKNFGHELVLGLLYETMKNE